LTIDGVCFPKPTNPIVLIVAMLTLAMISNKNLLDMGWGAFDITTMLINGIEEKAKYDTFFSNVNPCEDIFTLDPQLRINEHIPSPAITAADIVAERVSEVGHGVIERGNKSFIILGNKVESFFIQKVNHWISLLR
jgi:hypothetical protein